MLQDMKEKHEKETNLKAQRDLMAKDAADKGAAAQVHTSSCAEVSTLACVCFHTQFCNLTAA